MREVASAAGVSVATVSRVVNGGYVSQAVRRRVRASMEAVGYEPDALGRSLRTGRTQTIGFVVDDISNPTYASMAKGIGDTVSSHGESLMIGSSDGLVERECQLLRLMLGGRRVDGLILSTADESNQRIGEMLRRSPTPVVLVDREVSGVNLRVLVNHRVGVEQAINYLLDLGHRRIGVLVGPTTNRPGRERLQAVRESHGRRGLELDPALAVSTTLQPDFGYRSTSELLELPNPPTALFVGGIMLVSGVLAALRDRRMSIPADISVIVSDDAELTRCADPPLTAVSRSPYEMGRAAVQLLREAVAASTRDAQPLRQRSLTVPTALVVRESCRAIRGDKGIE